MYDNFSSGREWHLASPRSDSRLRVVRGDVADLGAADEDDGGSRDGHPSGLQPGHRASGDGASGRFRRRDSTHAPCRRGDEDFRRDAGSSTHREAACTATLASTRLEEDYGPLIPVSTYGASKLAGEALIAVVLFHVRTRRMCVPLRKRRRPASDARCRLRLSSAPAPGFVASSTSLATAASRSRISTSRDVVRAVLTGGRAGASAVLPHSTWPLVTT